MNNKLPQELYRYVHENTLVGVKAGVDRESFLNIWMVEVEGRLFSRSWNQSERSWFTEFVRSGVGEIKFADKVIGVSGKKVAAASSIQPKIDQAYLNKYTEPHNIEYVKGISQPQYHDYTLEFFSKE